MAEGHKLDGFGRRLDDVETVFTGREALQSYDDARAMLRAFRVPSLLHAGNERERLFIANFDGTGNDAAADPEHMTNVGIFAEELAGHGDPRVVSRYLRGPGTHPWTVVQLPDAAWGISNDARVRDMYVMFARQVSKWRHDDPNADVRLLIVGFSRGAEQGAALSRMVDEKGVEIPDGRGIRKLIAPGQIPQAVALFDPVGTGHPQAHNRRLPSSVVSGVQVVAADEKRSQFPSTSIIRQGQSEDGRFLGVTVAGSHSDIGGSYHVDGLARANRAFMADYVNSLREGGLVSRPDLYSSVADHDYHRSQDHSIIYSTGFYRRHGERDTRGAERHPPHCRPVEACAPPEPADVALLERLGPRHQVEVGKTPLDVIDRQREVDREHAVLPGHATHPNPMDATRDEALRIAFAPRSTVPDAPSPDHPKNSQSKAQERDNHIDFSHFPRLDNPQTANDNSIPAPTSTKEREPDESPARQEATANTQSASHPQHRDHAMYQSVHKQLETLHSEQGITLSDQQMDRLAHCSVATAKRCHMSEVTHMSLGVDRDGKILPEVHMYEAFRNDVTDPRTTWGKVDALQAFQTPEHVASQNLQVANQQMDQFQQDQQMRMSQEQSQGMSMSR